MLEAELRRILPDGYFIAKPGARSDEIQRMVRAGLVAIPNISFAYYIGDAILDCVGEKRLTKAFPFRTLLKNGVVIAGGSDSPGYWPVDPLRDIATVRDAASEQTSLARMNGREVEVCGQKMLWNMVVSHTHPSAMGPTGPATPPILVSSSPVAVLSLTAIINVTRSRQVGAGSAK